MLVSAYIGVLGVGLEGAMHDTLEKYIVTRRRTEGIWLVM